jgi:hypothetical protein
VEEKNINVETTNKKKRNERVKLDLCQGKEMKSPKRSSLFTNNPTIPEIDEYVPKISNSDRKFIEL